MSTIDKFKKFRPATLNAYSFSKLTSWDQCPYRFYAENISKEAVFVDTPATLLGKQFHKEVEDYIGGGGMPSCIELGKNVTGLLQKVVKFKPRAEEKLAVTQDCQPCQWLDNKVRFRAIPDLTIKTNRKMLYLDWKTGSDYQPKLEQLYHTNVVLFAFNPDIDTIDSRLVFTKTDRILPGLSMNRDEAADWWVGMENDMQLIDTKRKHNLFEKKKSGLCKWCNVKSCEFNPN